MRSMKKYLIGAVIGLLIGMWFGVNIGQDRPIWANPFNKRTITEKAKDVTSDVIKDTKKAIIKKLED